MYHHVADLPAGATELERTWTVSPKNLAAQVEMLVARGFHAVTMADVSAYLRKGKALPSRPIVISFDDGWETDYSVAFPILRRFGLVGTFYVYSNSIDRNQFLKWSEIDEMVHAGMEFGSHTLSHPHLKTLPTDAAKKEIVESKLALEKHLGRPITAFAYPFGEYNSQVTELVKNAGYETAVTIAAGYKQRSEEIYALHRTRVTYSDSLQDLTGRLP
jgi:peptidoglycan/xylan/chitin deacetylase (PgdA/CDA1 family)